MARFIGTARNDTLIGFDSSDLLLGLAGNDSLTGGLGDDVLDGGIGIDTLAGGQGNDRYFLDTLGETIVEAVGEGRDLVTVRNAAALTNAFDNVEDYVFVGNARVTFRGSVGDNSITGGAASDTLHGGGDLGADTLNGGAGADVLDGGGGDDVYIVDNAGDIVREEGGFVAGGDDTVLSSVSHILGSGIEFLQLTGKAAINGTGNDLGNDLIGNGAANRLLGLGDEDILRGGGGNDTLDGGLGNDSLQGGAGNDTYFVDSTDDDVSEDLAGAAGGVDTVVSSASFDISLRGNVENLRLAGSDFSDGTGNDLNNRITGNDGLNNLKGGAGNDTLDGGAGDDLLQGGDGKDLMLGGIGSDLYIVERGDKVVETVAGPAGGIDVVLSFGGGDFTLGANVENLEFRGSKGAAIGNSLDNLILSNGDRLLGLAGADTLVAGPDSETLDGGKGPDLMEGGAESDTYFVDDVADVVVEEASGGAFDTIRTTLSVMAPVAGVENYVFLGSAVNFTGDAGFNDITGTKFNDTLNGGGGEGILFGGAGNDFLTSGVGNSELDGGSGADTLIGNSSNDGYIVDNVGDVVDELSGGDGGADVVGSFISYSLVANGNTLSGNIEGLLLFGTANLTGTGNDLANSMFGNAGSNRLFGGLGSDTLIGAGGNDTLDGGADDDTLIGEGGNDLIIVSEGNDTVEFRDKLDGRDLVQGFDGDVAGGQDVIDLDGLFDSLGIATADRTAHLQITDKGSTVEIRIDTSVAGDGVFDYFAVTLQTADAITVGSDIILS